MIGKPVEWDNPELVERFWASVAKRGSSECWDWLLSSDKSGWGRFTFRGQTMKAHRVAWAVALHEDPGEKGRHPDGGPEQGAESHQPVTRPGMPVGCHPLKE